MYAVYYNFTLEGDTFLNALMMPSPIDHDLLRIKLSIDNSIMKYLGTLKNMNEEDIPRIEMSHSTYPILADTTRNLSAALDILDAEWVYDEEMNDEILEGSNVTYRATYLIDEEGKIFHESVNDMPLGRNVNEYIRLIDAYTHVQTKGEVCPANWEEGKDAMSADRNSTASYLASH
jgi:alkyl hydroperoxide reductase subunit AhpC